MNYLKIVSRIAMAFGIAFVVFAALAAFVTYEQITIQYQSNIPASIVQLSVVNAMLPFALYAVLSFVVARFSSRATRENDKEESKVTVETEEQSSKS